MSMEKQKQKTRMMVMTAILGGIIIVLQLFAGSIPIGSFTITLSLVPIILGAVLFGPLQGAILGGVFGAIVCISVVNGTDIGGHIMYQQLPFITLFLCMLKGVAAGFAAGLVYKALRKFNTIVGVIAAAIVAPVCNTALLSAGMLVFYRNLVDQWALGEGFTSAFAYIIFGMCGLNFIVELTINVILSPVIVTVYNATKKRFR